MTENMPSVAVPYLKAFDETDNLLLVVTSYKIQKFMTSSIKRDFTSKVVDVNIYEIETPFIAKHQLETQPLNIKIGTNDIPI